MTIDAFMQILVTAGPALAAIGSMIAAAIKIVKSGRDSSKEISDAFEVFKTQTQDEYRDLKNRYDICLQQNYELNKKLNELLTKIDKIQRGD